MNALDPQEFALSLLRADSEDEVIEILTNAGFWQNRNAWRLYGDKEGNFAQVGNQQSVGEAALVEKLVNAKNKQRIKFVQGKFNMGGSGALRFSGSRGLQLVISRRHPKLAENEAAEDPSVSDWAVTIVRREEPTSESGQPIHSEFAYLAPVDSEAHPRKGQLLHFYADKLPLMPVHDEPYSREIAWGTAIKLYEYKTSVRQSNILLPDGLLYALERLLPQVALPIRLHECRGYQGVKERSFETTLSGLTVRLEEGRGDNLEDEPITCPLRSGGMEMTAKIYVFKEEKAATYLANEGVIFSINGQAHGDLPKSIFSRKSVGLSRLKDSLLVIVDCSKLSAMVAHL